MIELLLEAERAMEMGRIDAAEALYRQIVEADPRNVIAVVGLARVTLERGDERGALFTALQALALDPENSAAQRMVTRLEEILRYRAEAAPGPAAVGPATTETPTDDPPAPASSPSDEPQPARRSLLGRITGR